MRKENTRLKRRVRYDFFDLKSEPDKHLDKEDHPELDNLPKKTIEQQVLEMIHTGEVLRQREIEALSVPDSDVNPDPDDYDTGIDEFSDPLDFVQATEYLKNLRSSVVVKKSSKNDEKVVKNDEKVVKNDEKVVKNE